MGLAQWLLLLLPLLRVRLTLNPSSNLSSEPSVVSLSPGSRCGPHEYEYQSGRRCCQRCPADQEMVSDCTPKQDRKCQCKTGEFYCDSENCPENCYRCTSCPGATLQTCNATRNTECAPAARPEPGPPAGSLAVSALVVSVVAIVITIAIAIAIAIGIAIAIAWWRRRGVLLPQWLCRFRTATSGEPGSHAILQPTGPVRGLPVPGAEITLLLPEEADAPTPRAQNHSRPSADPDPGAGVELQVEVTGDGRVAPEPTPPTPAAAALGAQAQAVAEEASVIEQGHK
ncbi:tumor necrosis factor receptor superfamily member 10D-like isoform X2 [Myotis yumanensis]|uniref:tumor necrosis factor receptor superfamily member 10D-like isoform X2 n=1 Tax=Myotis yumanensis TaxID=159337 RepID=UPI0038D4D62E